MKPALVLAFVLTAGASARAEDTPTHVGGVEVVAGPGPTVTSSFPANGASVDAGVVVLKIVFDQPMTPDAWAYGKADTGAFPQCLALPRLLEDRRTFALLCTIGPNQAYAIQINPAPAFRNAGGRSARPYALSFTTTANITRNMHDALSQAGLTDTDEPLMSWNDPGKGVSRSPPTDLAGAPAP